MVMTMFCPGCRKKEAERVEDKLSERFDMYAFKCKCGYEFMTPQDNTDINNG